MAKYLHDHEKHSKLASRHDALMHTLLEHGKHLGKALPAVQKEFKAVQKKIDRLENKLYKEGYIALDRGIVLNPSR